MNSCTNCGKSLDGDVIFCTDCGTPVKAEKNDLAEVETSSTELAEVEAKTIRKKLGKSKTKIVEKGKESAVNFIVRKIITWILTAIISVVTVYISQADFKGEFRDYYNNTARPMVQKMTEVNDFIQMVEAGANFENITEYYEENKIGEKVEELYKMTLSCPSDHKDVVKFHNAFSAVCEEMLEVTMVYFEGSELGQKVELSQENYALEINLAVADFKTKAEVLESVKNELMEKYGLEKDTN